MRQVHKFSTPAFESEARLRQAETQKLILFRQNVGVMRIVESSFAAERGGHCVVACRITIRFSRRARCAARSSAPVGRAAELRIRYAASS